VAEFNETFFGGGVFSYSVNFYDLISTFPDLCDWDTQNIVESANLKEVYDMKM
jgi:hypothetical protein